MNYSEWLVLVARNGAACFQKKKFELGDEFERTIVEMVTEIVELQYEGTKPMSFYLSAFLLFDAEEQPRQEDFDEMVLACCYWHVLNKKEEDNALKQLLDAEDKIS